MNNTGMLGSISKSINKEESIKGCFRSSQILNAIPSPNFSALRNSAFLSVLVPNCPLPSSVLPNRSFRAQAVLGSEFVGFPRSLALEGWVRLGRNLPMSLNPPPMLFFHWIRALLSSWFWKHSWIAWIICE